MGDDQRKAALLAEAPTVQFSFAGSKREVETGQNGTQLAFDRSGSFWQNLFMPRRARMIQGGLVYHVMNRSVAGLPLFRGQADFEAFESQDQLHPRFDA